MSHALYPRPHPCMNPNERLTQRCHSSTSLSLNAPFVLRPPTLLWLVILFSTYSTECIWVLFHQTVGRGVGRGTERLRALPDSFCHHIWQSSLHMDSTLMLIATNIKPVRDHKWMLATVSPFPLMNQRHSIFGDQARASDSQWPLSVMWCATTAAAVTQPFTQFPCKGFHYFPSLFLPLFILAHEKSKVNEEERVKWKDLIRAGLR